MHPQSRNLPKEMNLRLHPRVELPERTAWLRAVVGAVTVVRLLILWLAWTAAPGQAAGWPEASGLRFGENGARTRIVLDLDRKVSFATKLEADPDQLIVELDKVVWLLGADAGRPLRGLARGYEVSTSNGRSILAVALAKPVRVVNSIILPPNTDSPFHRLVIDVVAEKAETRQSVASPAVTAVAAPTVVGRSTAPVPASRPATLAALPSVAGQVNGHAAPAAGPRKRDLPVVVLDPGHGGEDPGATSVDGLYEKDLVLEMARELRTLIERSGRYRVVLTRDSDEFIRLRDRIAGARKLGGEIFISLHADSLRLSEQRGASIYTLSEKASDEEAAKFAPLENKADVLTGADLSQHDVVVATILIDLAQRDTNNRSIAFADIMAEELARVTALVKRHRRFAGFAVLKSPDIPSVLLELGYLSNPDDARNLAQPDYRAKLGQAIVRSLDQYFAVPRT